MPKTSRHSRLGLRIFVVLLLLVLFGSRLQAQTSGTAALTGTATDATGAVIANATVTATNSGSGQVRTTKTGSDGVYNLTLQPPGNYGIGHILGPGQDNWDMTVSKTFQIRESQTLQFRTEFFNTFNTPQFNNPNTNAGAATGFGQITSTSVNPRPIQFALEFNF